MNKITSVRAVYALIALLLIIGVANDWMGLIVFVAFMRIFGS